MNNTASPAAQTTYEPHLLTRRDGAVATAILNRPQALNALSLEIIEELSENLALWEADDSVKMVFLCGAGGSGLLRGRGY